MEFPSESSKRAKRQKNLAKEKGRPLALIRMLAALLIFKTKEAQASDGRVPEFAQLFQ
jgi:hypothetical protein